MVFDLVLVGLAVSAAAAYVVRLVLRRVRGKAAACSCAAAQSADLSRGAKPGGSACSTCSGCPYSANGSCLDTTAAADAGSSHPDG
ncbi:MAG: hypothetical protein KKI09_05745 [Spirochaetes bacterium]|nr:hypothetical protein [Spirochaetota bacterium]MBU0954918.1 hypothetical protein [Spirochaetota bacterium]